MPTILNSIGVCVRYFRLSTHTPQFNLFEEF